MFQVQLQLRILCNHGTYQQPFSWNKRSLLDEREDALCATGGSGEVNCSGCRETIPILSSNNIYGKRLGNCAHVLCSECVDEAEQISGESTDGIRKCPLCAISGALINASEVVQQGGAIDGQDDSYLRANGTSSKINALISDMKEDLWKTKRCVNICEFHKNANDLFSSQYHLLLLDQHPESG